MSHELIISVSCCADCSHSFYDLSFISDELLGRELSGHRKMVSPIKKDVSSGCKEPKFSLWRQVFMVLNNKGEELNLMLKLRID